MIGIRIIAFLAGLGMASWMGHEAFSGFVKHDVDNPMRYIFGLLGDALIKTKRLSGGAAVAGGIFWFILSLTGGLFIQLAFIME